jgi:hypothetical protein
MTEHLPRNRGSAAGGTRCPAVPGASVSPVSGKVGVALRVAAGHRVPLGWHDTMPPFRWKVGIVSHGSPCECRRDTVSRRAGSDIMPAFSGKVGIVSQEK